MERCKHEAMPKVGDVCPDDAAVLALSVTRFIAAGYMTGDVACWDAAYNGAERVLVDRAQRLLAIGEVARDGPKPRPPYPVATMH